MEVMGGVHFNEPVWKQLQLILVFVEKYVQFYAYITDII